MVISEYFGDGNNSGNNKSKDYNYISDKNIKSTATPNEHNKSSTTQLNNNIGWFNIFANQVI